MTKKSTFLATKEKTPQATNVWCFPSTKKRFDAYKLWSMCSTNDDALNRLLDFWELNRIEKSRSYEEVLRELWDIEVEEENAKEEVSKLH